MENISEVIKILEGALKANASMASNYAGLLAEKLDEAGELKQARLIRDRLARAKPAIAEAQDSTRGYGVGKPPADAESRLETVDVSYPTACESKVILPTGIQERVKDLFDNVRHFDALRKADAALPNRLLIDGPPGTGKTRLARWVSAFLDLPLYTVRCDTLINSLLGQTSKNLRKVFDFVQQQPCVLFLDEFDSLASARNNNRDVGELQRVVIALLQNIDSMSESSILVAATNHASLLDTAVWRRFGFRISMPMPDNAMREELWREFMGDFGPEQLDYKLLARLSNGTTGAVIEQVCIDAKRNAILKNGGRIDSQYVIQRLGLTVALANGIDTAHLEKEISWLRKWNPSFFSIRKLSSIYGISRRRVTKIVRELSDDEQME